MAKEKAIQSTPAEKLKRELRVVSSAVATMQRDAGFTRWALITLLHAKTKVPKRTLTDVLDGLEDLVNEVFEDPEDNG